LSHAQSYLGDTDVGGLPKRTVLIGDAAHTVHPMAGQGLNLGLGDAAALFETLETAIAGGADIGSKLALNPYPRKRYFTNHTVMNVIDKLHKLYAQQAAPIVWARSTGVEILNELPSLKKLMMGTAGARDDKGSPKRKAVYGGMAKAYEMAEGARNIGGVFAGIVRQRIANAVSK
jgi:ubiquinone biosynthesis monooxygenase Coq6